MAELLDSINAVNDDGDVVPKDDVFPGMPDDNEDVYWEELMMERADIEAYYDILNRALDAAASFVRANGRRKANKIDNPETPAMKHARKWFEKEIGNLNTLAKTMPKAADGRRAIIYRPTVFLEQYVGCVDLYDHTITRGKNKGQVKKRTVSSCRIAGYRRLIEKYREELKFVSARGIEREFWASPDSAELH